MGFEDKRGKLVEQTLIQKVIVNVTGGQGPVSLNAPSTGFDGTAQKSLEFITNDGLILVFSLIAVVAGILAVTLLIRKLTLKKTNTLAIKRSRRLAKVSGLCVLVGVAALTVNLVIPTFTAKADPTTILSDAILNITLPNTSTTTNFSLDLSNSPYNVNSISVKLDSVSGSGITLTLDGKTLSTALTSLVECHDNDSYSVNLAAAIPSNLSPGQYEAIVSYEIESIPPVPAPLAVTLSKATNIVPNFASTIAPTGNGSGTNGPQFSIRGSDFGVNPTVTIGGQPCTDVVVNSAGIAITCAGPVSGITDGEKRVVINGTDMGNDATVWYTSYGFPTLQSLTASGTCIGTSITPVIYRDARDSQLYYVAKLQDNKCWMLDNLRYKPNGDTSGTAAAGFSATQQADTGTYLTNNGTNSPDSNDPNIDAALYVDPIANTTETADYCRSPSGTNNMPAENISKCGLLYNFYTANAGTLLYSNTTNGTQSTGSICPANWRLPTAKSTTTGPGNGTSYNYADFAILNASMNAGIFTTPGVGTNFHAGWQPTGPWRGVFSEFYGTDFGTNDISVYWSSTVGSTPAYGGSLILYPNSPTVYPGNANYYRYLGFAVRCAL